MAQCSIGVIPPLACPRADPIRRFWAGELHLSAQAQAVLMARTRCETENTYKKKKKKGKVLTTMANQAVGALKEVP